MIFIQLQSRRSSDAYSICKSKPNSSNRFTDKRSVGWSYPDNSWFTPFKLEFITEPITEREWVADDIPF